MNEMLKNSMFYQVIFPKDRFKDFGDSKELALRQLRTYNLASSEDLKKIDFVIFDLETTGLDTRLDRIIEIGAIRFNWSNNSTKEFSYLINPQKNLSLRVQELTGLSDLDLRDKSTIQEVLPEFFDFIDGCVLVAHNADFDYKFLQNVCDQNNIDFNWACFCTLKLSRKIHPELMSRSLDALAANYGLQFSSRHRSMGDCEVTLNVLKQMWNDSKFTALYWQDLLDFYPSVS